MAIESLNMLLDPTGKMLLAELDKGLIQNIQINTISAQLKNTSLSGDPQAGTLKAKRFQNATSNSYGTARAAGKGQSVKGKDVTIDIDTDREFVEELEEKDIKLSGVSGVLTQRSSNHRLMMVSELDTAFFAEAKASGTGYTAPSGVTAPQEILENAALTLQTLKTAYVQGVPRNRMSFILSPSYYSAVRNYLDTVNNTGITVQNENVPTYHGVKVFSSINLPTGTDAGDTVDFIVMVDGSIAQPVMVDQYAAERVPLSNAMAVELFYHYGTKAVTPELVLVASH